MFNVVILGTILSLHTIRTAKLV